MFSVVLYGCHGFSVCSRRFSVVLVDFQWFSVALTVGYRRFSMVLIGSQLFLVVLVASQLFSFVHTCSRRFSVVLVDSQWLSVVLSVGFQWYL